MHPLSQLAGNRSGTNAARLQRDNLASKMVTDELAPWQFHHTFRSIKKPTPIQENCIVPILEGRDCIGCAKTGSGKTLAFALPILNTLSDDPYGIYSLILTPTRELAIQIADQFKVIGKPLNLNVVVVIGGKDMMVQGKELADRPHVVVATPGRLADHLQSCDTFTLKKIRYLVLDEADRMLDGSFDEQLSTIFKALPQKRQTLLFSATISDAIKQLKDVALSKNPFFWEDAGTEEEDYQATVAQLDQRLILTPSDAIDAYLVYLVQTFRDANEKGLIIIFVKTCHTCQLLGMTLNKLGFPCVALHSMKPQRERSAALTQFRSHQTRILIATDVASRGLDIPEVQLVINHNVPSVAKDYVHRVGRTARAGRPGKAYTLVTPTDVKLVHAIETLIGTNLVEMEVDDESIATIHAQVGVTKREQDITLSEMDFDERRNINKRKKIILEGRDPDEEEKEKERSKKMRMKTLKKEKKEKFRAAKKEKLDDK